MRSEQCENTVDEVNGLVMLVLVPTMTSVMTSAITNDSPEITAGL